MCTAISDVGAWHLFGRTLDLEYSYNESVVITPRKFRFDFCHEHSNHPHLAMIGIAHVRDGVPLYYDAINESGLAIAALNFSDYTEYHPPRNGSHNVASFELIPWLLGQCESLSSAEKLLQSTNITSDCFRPNLPTTPLHWLIADRHGAIAVESVSSGLRLYENPFGVLANSPDFPYQQTNLSTFMQVGTNPPQNQLFPRVELPHYSRGMGGIGLPGDFTSPSRFVRAVFAKAHTVHGSSEDEEISRFFHMMELVTQPLGCSQTETNKPISTVYTSCANATTKAYYFTTYDCRRIRGISLSSVPLDSSALFGCPMKAEEDIFSLNLSKI